MPTNKERQAVILAGGKGTRLRSRLADVPKPLVQVGRTPLLGHQFQLLKQHGFTDVVLLVNYGAEQFYEYCHGLGDTGFKLSVIDDGEPRGTAGAVLRVAMRLEDQFAVLYGDTMLSVDLGRFWEWHSRESTAAASLFLHPNNHPEDSDLVEVDENNRILRFHPYPHAKGAYLRNLVNAALYIVRREALPKYSETAHPLDFAKDLFPSMLRGGALLRGYISPEYVKDVGTPDRLDRVRRDFSQGVISRSSLTIPQRAVFMDRDGTLNEARGHIGLAEELRVFDFVGPALRRLNESEWRAVVITNQPVLARGETTIDELRRIHNKLDTEVAREQAYFDRVYICPHHPDRGFSGEVSELKVSCSCRKPGIGLIRQAERDLNLDLAESWFIGDSTADMSAAAMANITSILVETGQAGLDGRYAHRPDFIVEDFAAAADLILDVYPRAAELCARVLDLIVPGSDWFIVGSPSASKFLSAVLRRELGRVSKSSTVLTTDWWLNLSALEAAYCQLQRRADCEVELHLPMQAREQSTRFLPFSPVAVPREMVVLWAGSTALQLADKVAMEGNAVIVDDRGKQVENAGTGSASAAHIMKLDSVSARAAGRVLECLVDH